MVCGMMGVIGHDQVVAGLNRTLRVCAGSSHFAQRADLRESIPRTLLDGEKSRL